MDIIAGKTYRSKDSSEIRKILEVKPNYNKKWLIDVKYVKKEENYNEDDFCYCNLKTMKVWCKKHSAD